MPTITWMRLLSYTTLLFIASCSDTSSSLTAIGGGDAAASGSDGAQLQDGWQKQADATPPDDSWIWNSDASRWVPSADASTDADPRAKDGATTSDSTAISDLVAGNDGASTGEDTTAGSDNGKMPVVPGGLGSSCTKQGQCDPGLYCFGPESGFGYCGKVGCQSNDECVVDTKQPMCCVKYGKQSYCTKQFGGATQCGTQSKPVGADCKPGGQSDCDNTGGSFCLEMQSVAQCVKGCLTDPQGCPSGTSCQIFDANTAGCIPFTAGKADGTPCAGAVIGGCGKGSWCVEAYPNDPLAYCASPCKEDPDCAKGFDCSIYAPGKGICQKHGKTQAGQNCAGDRFSCAKGLFCLGAGSAVATCVPGCDSDAACADFAKAIGQPAYCAKGPAGGGACLAKGDKANGGNCSKDPGSCTPGSWCIGGYDAYNPDAYCQKPCGANSDGKCPDGAVCTSYNAEYAGCQVNGIKGQGDSCAGAATSCKAGHFCVGPQGGEVCGKICKPSAAAGTADACATGSWCSGYGDQQSGVCLPGGTIAIGKPCQDKPLGCAPQSFCQSWGKGSDSVCISACGPNKACPAGTDCKDYGQAGAYCQPVGGATQGQPCSNAAGACAPGLACLSAGTTYAMCSKSCKADAECGPSAGKPGGLYCATGKWGGWCVPDGGVAEYESCYNKAWQCKKGLACVGDPGANPGATCTKQCTGFADVCGESAKCQYFGNGQSWCVKTGTLPAGSNCLGMANDCAANTLCVKGTPQPMCLQQCGYGFAPCPTETPCTYFAGSAIQLCVPKGFTVGGAIRAPF